MLARTGRQAIDYFFDLTLYLFAATGFIAVAATGRLDLPTILIVGAALALRAVSLAGMLNLRIPPGAVRVATILYIVFYIVDFLAFGNFVSATGHLLFFLLVMKLFSAETNRDYLYLGVMAFMEMLLAAILTISTAFLGLFVVFLMCGIAAFSSFEIKRGYAVVADDGGRSAEITGDPPAFLRGIGFTAAFVTLGVLLAGGLLFFMIPRVSTGYLSNLAQSQTITGFSDTVTLGDLGTIKQSTSPVMHVKITSFTNQRMPALRWRGKGYIHFDGKRWTDNSSTIVIPPNPFNPNQFSLAGVFGRVARRSETVAYSVTLEPISTDTLFLAPRPLLVTGRFRLVEVDSTDTVLSHYSNFAGLRYDAVSNVAVPTPIELRGAAAEYPPAVLEFLQLPKLDSRVRELALDVSGKVQSPYDKASAIEQHLRTKYGYTLELLAGGDDPIADFLFRVRKGHCEYFAASMTVMLRSIGIPAREVTGFLSGEYNDITQQYVVRGTDAHSWVEVYFPGYGWVAFDPTPAAGTEPGSRGLGSFSKWVDAGRTFWNDWIVSYDFARQFTAFRQIDRTSRQLTTDTRGYLRRHYDALRHKLEGVHKIVPRGRGLLPWVAIVAGLACFLYLGAPRLVSVLREWRSRARVRAGRATSHDVSVAYEHFLDLMSNRGLTRPPATTPRQFAESIADPLVRDFTVAFEEARYGGSTERLPELYRLLAQLERAPRTPVVK